MGCVTSRKDINDLHSNIFQVSNVDDSGNHLSSGELEVNETELVLYQRGKQPIRWPLKSLRRYGYDSQVFSFEAGRRCPTGSGIYAFSCHRAEQLFNYVQAHVQTRNDDTVSRDLGTPTPVPPGSGGSQRGQDANYLEPTPIRHNLPRLSIHNGPSRLSSVGSSNGCTSPSSPLANNNYTNEDLFRAEEKYRQSLIVPEEPPPPTDQSITPVSPTLSEMSTREDKSSSPIYMNVQPGLNVLRETDELDEVPKSEAEEEKHEYANVIPGEIEGLPRMPSKPTLSLQLSTISSGVGYSCPITPPGIIRSVNYIVLDLGKSTVPSSPTLPDSPPYKPSEGYVTIDFDRTVALSNTANQPSMEDDGEGVRKTRHNSTFNDLTTPTSSRHSTSLSD